MTQSRRGFSLIEVVLATALLAFSIVAVIGLLGLAGRSVSDVQDFGTASQLSEVIQGELLREPFDSLVALLATGQTVTLFGTKNGDRVVLERNKGNDPLTGNPPGMNPSDRYFLIEIDDPTATASDWADQMVYDPTYSSFVTLKVEVRWPHFVRRGPGPGREDDPRHEREKQRSAVFHMAVPRRFE